MNFQQLVKLSTSKYRYRTPAENEAEVRFFVDSNAEFEMICTMPLDGVSITSAIMRPKNSPTQPIAKPPRNFMATSQRPLRC